MPSVRSHAFSMFLSAALFAVVGFYLITWEHRHTRELGPDGQPFLLPMIVLLMWTLRGGAILFAVGGVMALLDRVSSLFLYSVVGLFCAAVFVAAAVWELSTPYFTKIGWPLLLIFAAWNGYSSAAGLREAVVIQRSRKDADH